MEFVADRVKETISAVAPASTAPTTSMTLAGAYDATFQTFYNAFGLNKPFTFVALDGNAWECGTGFLSSTSALQIIEVNASTSGNLALSTNAIVWCDAHAKNFKDIKGVAFSFSKSYGMP